MSRAEQQLTIPEVAQRLAVDVSTVWRWIRQGRISPVTRLSAKATRVPESALARFLESRSVEGPPVPATIF